jgi:hypothetical protein
MMGPRLGQVIMVARSTTRFCDTSQWLLVLGNAAIGSVTIPTGDKNGKGSCRRTHRPPEPHERGLRRKTAETITAPCLTTFYRLQELQHSSRLAIKFAASPDVPLTEPLQFDEAVGLPAPARG